MHRAAKKLKNYKYSDDENTDNIRGTVMALVDTYNNSIDSASNSSSSSMKRYAKQLKSWQVNTATSWRTLASQ